MYPGAGANNRSGIVLWQVNHINNHRLLTAINLRFQHSLRRGFFMCGAQGRMSIGIVRLIAPAICNERGAR